MIRESVKKTIRNSTMVERMSAYGKIGVCIERLQRVMDKRYPTEDTPVYIDQFEQMALAEVDT